MRYTHIEVLANRPGIILVIKNKDRIYLLIDVAIPSSDRNII
jgi:hypothetical protein